MWEPRPVASSVGLGAAQQEVQASRGQVLLVWGLWIFRDFSEVHSMGHLFVRTTELACVLVGWVESQGGVSLMETQIWFLPMPASWVGGELSKAERWRRKLPFQPALKQTVQFFPCVSGTFQLLPGLEPGVHLSARKSCVGLLEQHLQLQSPPSHPGLNPADSHSQRWCGLPSWDPGLGAWCGAGNAGSSGDPCSPALLSFSTTRGCGTTTSSWP